MKATFRISKSDLEKQNPLIATVDDVNGYVVYKSEEGIKVYRNFCPHMGSAFSQKGCTGNGLRCPWHGYEYDLSSGNLISNPGIENWIKHLVPEESPYRQLRKLKLIASDWIDEGATILIRVKGYET